MGRWLDALRDKEKNAEMPLSVTDKTDETSINMVLSVSSVHQKHISENFSGDADSEASVSSGLSVRQNAVFVKNSETATSTPSDTLQGLGGFGWSSNTQIVENSSSESNRRHASELGQKPDIAGQIVELIDEKNAKTPISGTAKTPKTCSVSFGSSSSSQIQDFFAPDPAGTWDDEDWQVAFEERAAIFEYDGGWSREAAEQFAHQWIEEQRAIKRSTQ